jgi:hypothetical protein
MTKPRKGEKHVPEIPILLRDAQPTWQEIDGELDQKKRRENERKRDGAIDELITIYREFEERGRVRELDPHIRLFCEQLKRRNGGKLPKRVGGRQTDMHRRLRIAMSVRDAITKKEAVGARGAVQQALKEVATKFNIAPRSVRDIYYDQDPQWLYELKAEIARRTYEESADSQRNWPSW